MRVPWLGSGTVVVVLPFEVGFLLYFIMPNVSISRKGGFTRVSEAAPTLIWGFVSDVSHAHHKT